MNSSKNCEVVCPIFCWPKLANFCIQLDIGRFSIRKSSVCQVFFWVVWLLADFPFGQFSILPHITSEKLVIKPILCRPNYLRPIFCRPIFCGLNVCLANFLLLDYLFGGFSIGQICVGRFLVWSISFLY